MRLTWPPMAAMACSRPPPGITDAIVLDLMLPVMDGWSVLKQLRKEGHLVPVLVLTARDAASGSDLRPRLGDADDYVVKPFQLDELHARLARSSCDVAVGKASSVIDLGEVQVDTAKHLVSRSGQPIPLTPREYSLVQLLALHRGELVTRSVIYDHLFDEEDDSLSNLVDVHVSNVRKKAWQRFYCDSAWTRVFNRRRIRGIAQDVLGRSGRSRPRRSRPRRSRWPKRCLTRSDGPSSSGTPGSSSWPC